MKIAHAFNVTRLSLVVVLASFLIACGDKPSNTPTPSASAGDHGAQQARASAVAKKSGSKAQPVLLRAAVNESDESSCWLDLTVQNRTRDKVSMMTRFDAVHADNGEAIEKAHNVESVIFNSVEAGASRGALQPAYIQEPCDKIRLHLRAVHCTSGDSEPELEAEGIAGIEDKIS